MKSDPLDLSTVNCYLAYKQHLLPTARLTDLVQITRDIVALHATDPTGPYLSLWARMPDFQKQSLEDALYERRELVKVLCMRVTLHAVPSDELFFFLRAFQTLIERRDPVLYRGPALLSESGLCSPEQAQALQEALYRKVSDLVAEKGLATVREITQALPELQTKIRHDVGKPYEGQFSVGSRLVPRMCVSGWLIRARPQGTWRSNLYQYAPLSNWLPEIDPDAITPQQARAWLVRRYLSAFGPANLDDVHWWTGLTKREVKAALSTFESELDTVVIEDVDGDYLMLVDDARRLRQFAPPDSHYVFLLPNLDPYIMGYKNRHRFLDPTHHKKVFDRAGNAVHTVWVGGRVVGVWGQRQDGSLIYRLFEPVGRQEETLMQREAQRLETFLDGEYLPPRFRTPFVRALQ